MTNLISKLKYNETSSETKTETQMLQRKLNHFLWHVLLRTSTDALVTKFKEYAPWLPRIICEDQDKKHWSRPSLTLTLNHL